MWRIFIIINLPSFIHALLFKEFSRCYLLALKLVSGLSYLKTICIVLWLGGGRVGLGFVISGPLRWMPLITDSRAQEKGRCKE